MDLGADSLDTVSIVNKSFLHSAILARLCSLPQSDGGIVHGMLTTLGT